MQPKRSHGYMARLFFSCAQKMQTNATMGIDEVFDNVRDNPNAFMTLQLMWDETQFRILTTGGDQTSGRYRFICSCRAWVLALVIRR